MALVTVELAGCHWLKTGEGDKSLRKLNLFSPMLRISQSLWFVLTITDFLTRTLTDNTTEWWNANARLVRYSKSSNKRLLAQSASTSTMCQARTDSYLLRLNFPIYKAVRTKLEFCDRVTSSMDSSRKKLMVAYLQIASSLAGFHRVVLWR